MFPVVDVYPEDAVDLGKVGSKEKFWFLRGSGDNEEEWLCKISRPNDGEDWSEKVAAELCRLLGLPHAVYELARYRTPSDTLRRAVVSRRMDVGSSHLILGDRILSDHFQRYEPAPDHSGFFINPAYTVEAVHQVLADSDIGIHPPDYWIAPVEASSAFGVFVGYLLLDAWIGNTDRHAQNWGVIERSSGGRVRLSLAPTFDHASCLGRERSDSDRKQKLQAEPDQHSIVGYLRKCVSRFVRSPDDSEKLHVHDVFDTAAQLDPDAAAFWRNRLHGIADSDIDEVFDSFPSSRISSAAVDFAKEILTRNRNDLLS